MRFIQDKIPSGL